MFKNEKQTGCKTTKGKDGVNIDSYFIRLKEGKKNVHFVSIKRAMKRVCIWAISIL